MPDVAGFFSYTHVDDEADDGAVTQLCEKLAQLTSAHLGRPFDLFLDRNDVRWGEQWEPRLTGAVDAATVLIPIVSPSYFTSEWCGIELDRFVAREKELGRNDLILPIYWRHVPGFKSGDIDARGKVLRAHQWVDFRDIVRDGMATTGPRRQVDLMAQRITAIVTREVRSAPVPRTYPPNPRRTSPQPPTESWSAFRIGTKLLTTEKLLVRCGEREYKLVVDSSTVRINSTIVARIRFKRRQANCQFNADLDSQRCVTLAIQEQPITGYIRISTLDIDGIVLPIK